MEKVRKIIIKRREYFFYSKQNGIKMKEKRLFENVLKIQLHLQNVHAYYRMNALNYQMKKKINKISTYLFTSQTFVRQNIIYDELNKDRENLIGEN